MHIATKSDWPDLKPMPAYKVVYDEYEDEGGGGNPPIFSTRQK